MAESSSVTEHTQALTLQGSCPADNGEYVNGVTFPDKMADDELLQGVTKETRNGDVYKHEAVGGFVLDYDKKADDGIYPTDDQKVPSAFCDEDTFMGDVPSCPVPREPEIPLGSDATSFPQQCEDFVGSNIDDSFSPFNSEMSSYSQTGSHESFPAFGGEREMDPTPEALPDPVPPMGQENVLIDFCEDSDPPADVKCDNTNPFVDLSPGEMTPSDPYSDVEPNNGNNKNTEQIVQSPLRHDAPEFSPQGHSNAEFSPLRHDAPEFLPREPQQAAVFDQSPHIGGLDGMERHSLSQSDTFDKPNEQVQDVIDSFDKCKENMPVPMEDQSVPAINITSDQGEDDEDYSGEEDYSESESNSQAENDEIIEDDYTDSEDTENIQDSDDVSGGPGEGRPVLGDGIVHPAFDQGSVKPAFSENEFQFQQQGLACDITAGHVELMPSVGAEPPVVGGITEGKGEQANEMGSSQMDMAQDSTERQPVGTGELQRDTICKSETFTIESDSDMEERSITPEQESMKTTRNNVMSGQDDSQSVQAHSGASPPFNYSQMDSSFNQQTVEPVFNQSQMEPAFNQGQMEPAFNQGQMEPAFNQGQMEPAFNQGQMEPAFNQGQMEPAFNQGQMEPAFNQGQMEHAFNQGQMEPAFNQDQMEPVFNQGQMEPAFNQEQMEPALNQGQMEPALNQGQEGPAFSQGQMEPAFNQEQMEPIKNQMQNEQIVLASHSETSPVEFHGDNMFTNQPVLQQEPEHKQQIAFQDEHDFPQQTDFQNDMVPSEGFTEDPVFSPEDTSKMELSPNKCHKQPDCREDVATPSEVLLENTPEQKYQLEESGVEHDQPVPLMSPCQQLEDAGFSQVFSQVVDDSFMDSENTQTNAETLVEPNTQKHAYEDEKGDADEDGDEDMFPDDQYSSSGEEKEEEDEGLLSHQPKPADATQLPSSEATSAYQKEEKASSEERSASLQEQKLTSEERSVSPEECDRNEYSESNAVEKGSGLSESQDKLVSEERSLSPEYHTLNDQKKIEAQGTYEEHTAPQSFEKKAPSLVPEMAAREIDQSTVDQTYGVTPATFQGSELERISSPDQAQSPVTVDTDRDTHTSGRNSEDFEYEQGEDSLTAEGGSDSDQDLPEQFDEDVDVQPNITDDSLADQPVPKETGLKEINEEQERLEAGSDMKESGMGESIITADSQETDDQSPSEIPRQMMEDYGDTERSLTSSMECQTYEDDAGVSPVEMAASLMEGSMVLKEGETDNVASSLSQSVPTESALEEYSKDRMEDEEIENIRHQLSPEILEVEPKSAHLAPQLRVSEDINVGEDVQKVYAAEEKVVSPSPVAEAPVPPTADQQVVVQEPTTAVQHASAPDKGTKKTDEKQDKFADKMEGATTKNVVKKIAEPTVKKSQVTEKIDKKEAKPKKQEKPITKTPQKPLRKPKQRTPPKSDDSKIPSPTKTAGGITKSTTRTIRSSVPSKTAPPKSLSVKQNTEKPPFDTSFPRAVSASRQRILPLAQTPTTPSPTKAPSKKIPTRTQSKEATQLFLERMSRPRCRTPKKDGSDSGVEEDKTPRATSATSQRKKYGIDAKNENYKPGGGNVKITDQKVTVKHVGSRIDARSKTPTGSPRKEATPKAKPTTPKGSTPDTKHVQSKIDSLKNSTHSPGGGNVKIAHQKVDYSTVQGKIGSKANLDHRPKGGDKKILSKKLEWKAESRVGSLDNAKHAPGGGKVKIVDEKVQWSTGSRIGSLDNAKHAPGGGNVKILDEKVAWKKESKVGSLENARHVPGGGNQRILDERVSWNTESKIGSLENTHHVPGGGHAQILDEKVAWKKESKVGSLENARHVPGGGNQRIINERVSWNTESKIGSLENTHHVPGGGHAQILHEKVAWKKESKVGSLENARHVPGGGNQRIINERVSWNTESKIGSLENTHHVPGGGHAQIINERVSWNTESKIGSLENTRHVPGGGHAQIINERVSWNTESKIGSLENTHHVPGGGHAQILDEKVAWKKESKVGSLENARHVPGGGNQRIVNERVSWNTESKIGSLENTHHVPGGGHAQIINERVSWNTESKIGSLENTHHVPGGGHAQIPHEKVSWKIQSKIGSVIHENAHHIPGGGDVEIPHEKVSWKKQSKIGSVIHENAHHKPGGGDVEITDEKVAWNSKSKIKAVILENVHHVPGGGDVQITDEKVSWNSESKIGSVIHENARHVPGGGDVEIINETVTWEESPKVRSLENIKHKPGGGSTKIFKRDKVSWGNTPKIVTDNSDYPHRTSHFKIETAKLDFKEKATSKVGSKDNMDHKAGGGNKKIETKKLDFKEKASSKVGSKDNVAHKPGGGDKKAGVETRVGHHRLAEQVLADTYEGTPRLRSKRTTPGTSDSSQKIESHKLTFKESAKPATDTGTGHVVSSPPCMSPSLKSPRPDSEISQDSLPQQATSPDNIDSSVPAQ